MITKRMITLYTDGSAQGNPGRGGYGGILAHGIHYKEYSQGYAHTTNNRMELMGVIAGLEAIKQPHQRVIVYTDSRYVAHAVQKEWLAKWEAAGFKKRKNSDLWRRFLTVYRKHNVAFQWIKGHAGNPLNERCDTLAVKAASQGPWLEDKGYEAL